MIYKLNHKVPILLLLVFCTIQLKAQNKDTVTYTPNHTYYWGGIHVGEGTYLINVGFDASLLLHNRFIIAGKLDGNANEFLWGNEYEERDAGEYGLMLGAKLTNKRYSNLMLLAGVSHTAITKRGDPMPDSHGFTTYGDRKLYTVVGLPIALKYLVTPTGFFAMDFGATANFNRQRSFFALTFGIAFGKLRDGGDHLPKLPSRY